MVMVFRFSKMELITSNPKFNYRRHRYLLLGIAVCMVDGHCFMVKSFTHYQSLFKQMIKQAAMPYNHKLKTF